MNDHVAKPIDVAMLFATLRKWLGADGPAAATAAAIAADTAQAAAAEGADTTAPAIDLATALRRLGGRREMLERLAVRFVQSEADAAHRIADALSAGDLETAMRSAHTLKGLAASLCANRLAGCAAQIEAALHAANDASHGTSVHAPQDAGLGERLSALGSALREVLDALAPLAQAAGPQGLPEAPADSPVRADLAGALRRLASLVADADLAATRDLDATLAALSQAGEAARARELGRLLADYDFDAVMPLLRGLAGDLGVELAPPQR